ncbi:MAG TPA: hypothetical protein VF581_04415 [Flavobacterium sp.]|jgi:hypothetical protein
MNRHLNFNAGSNLDMILKCPAKFYFNGKKEIIPNQFSMTKYDYGKNYGKPVLKLRVKLCVRYIINSMDIFNIQQV